jgi:hypothetical protein
MVDADSHIKLLPIILYTYTVFEYIDIDMLSIGIYGSHLTQLYPRTGLRFWGSGSLVESK